MGLQRSVKRGVAFAIVLLSLPDSGHSQEGVRPEPRTVHTVYPELRASDAPSTFYQYRTDFPSTFKRNRPDTDAWIRSLVKETSPDPTNGYIQVWTFSDHLQFVKIHGKETGEVFLSTVYKLEPLRIQTVTCFNVVGGIRGLGVLFPTQIGVDQWVYEYDQKGRIETHLALQGDPSGGSSVVVRKSYTYWPNSERVQSISTNPHVLAGYSDQTRVEEFSAEGTKIGEKLIPSRGAP